MYTVGSWSFVHRSVFNMQASSQHEGKNTRMPLSLASVKSLLAVLKDVSKLAWLNGPESWNILSKGSVGQTWLWQKEVRRMLHCCSLLSTTHTSPAFFLPFLWDCHGRDGKLPIMHSKRLLAFLPSFPRIYWLLLPLLCSYFSTELGLIKTWGGKN